MVYLVILVCLDLKGHQAHQDSKDNREQLVQQAT